MRKLNLVLIFTLPILFSLAGCKSGTPPQQQQPSAQPSAPAKKEEPATQLHTGREAFQRLYVAAHGWAPDARPFRLQSEATADAPGKDGKAAVWRAGFASAARRSIKTFVWSGTRAEGAPEPGITSGAEDTYSPSNRGTLVFDINFLKVDSPQAYEVAQKHGGDKILKQHPDQPITYLLDWDPSENMLVWHVSYGSSPREARLRVAANATSGAFLRVEK